MGKSKEKPSAPASGPGAELVTREPKTEIFPVSGQVSAPRGKTLGIKRSKMNKIQSLFSVHRLSDLS